MKVRLAFFISPGVGAADWLARWPVLDVIECDSRRLHSALVCTLNDHGIARDDLLGLIQVKTSKRIRIELEPWAGGSDDKPGLSSEAATPNA